MPPELTRFFIDNLPMIVLGVLGIWMILALWPDDAPSERGEPESDGPGALAAMGAAVAAGGAAVALLDEPEPASLPDDLPDAYDQSHDGPDDEEYAEYPDDSGDWPPDEAIIPADELAPSA